MFETGSLFFGAFLVFDCGVTVTPVDRDLELRLDFPSPLSCSVFGLERGGISFCTAGFLVWPSTVEPEIRTANETSSRLALMEKK